MSKLHIWLLTITTYICTSAVMVFFMVRSGSELPMLIHSLVCVALFIPVSLILDRRDREDRRSAYQKRLRPVRDLVRSCMVMEGKESEYQHRLLHRLRETLHVVSKPEAPLPSGTRLDAYMEFGDEDWYITIKRRIDNPKRLILQGEIEDIILHAPRRDRDPVGRRDRRSRRRTRPKRARPHACVVQLRCISLCVHITHASLS